MAPKIQAALTCAVLNCKNNEYGLKKWRMTVCEKCKIPQRDCGCKEPYR